MIVKKNHKFRVLNIDPNKTTLILDFAPDSSSDNVVSAAIYKRNNIIQERYNMTFVEEPGGDYKDLDNKYTTLVSSSDSTYSLVTMIQRYALSTHVSKITPSILTYPRTF